MYSRTYVSPVWKLVSSSSNRTISYFLNYYFHQIEYEIKDYLLFPRIIFQFSAIFNQLNFRGSGLQRA